MSEENLPDNKKKESKIETPISSLSDKDEFEERIMKLIEKGRRRGRRYSIIGITTSILIAVAVLSGGYYLLTEITRISERTDKEITPFLEENSNEFFWPKEWRNCSHDTDCIETQANCCDCRHGGRQVAINRGYLNKWREILSEKCQNVTCITLMSCRNGQVICEEGECRFKKEKKN